MGVDPPWGHLVGAGELDHVLWAEAMDDDLPAGPVARRSRNRSPIFRRRKAHRKAVAGARLNTRTRI